MEQETPNGRPLGRLLVPVALAHVVCCGGLILWTLIGSAGIAALGGYLSDPLLQAAGLMIGVGVGIATWSRHRARRAAPSIVPPSAPAPLPSGRDRSRIA